MWLILKRESEGFFLIRLTNVLILHLGCTGVSLDLSQENKLFPTVVSKKHIHLKGLFLEITIER